MGGKCYPGPGHGVAAEFAVVVDETGKVGVGTATPSAPLHVIREEDAMVMAENTLATKAARVSRVGRGQADFKFFDTGNMTIRGAYTENSSRASKRDIEEVDTKAVLAIASGKA